MICNKGPQPESNLGCCSGNVRVLITEPVNLGSIFFLQMFYFIFFFLLAYMETRGGAENSVHVRI